MILISNIDVIHPPPAIGIEIRAILAITNSMLVELEIYLFFEEKSFKGITSLISRIIQATDLIVFLVRVLAIVACVKVFIATQNFRIMMSNFIRVVIGGALVGRKAKLRTTRH